MPPSVYPTTAIVALSSRFLPRYDDGSLDHTDLSIMSSPHIWNLLELPRIKVLLSLVWSIVWMPPLVCLTTAIVASSSRFLPGYDVGSLVQADLSIMFSSHIYGIYSQLLRIKVLLSLVCSIVWMPPSVYPVMQSWHPLVNFFLGMLIGAWTIPICLSCPVHIYGNYSNFHK